MLPEAHLSCAKLNIKTILSERYSSYNCVSGHVKPLAWGRSDEVGIMLFGKNYPSPPPFLTPPLPRWAPYRGIPTASLEPCLEAFSFSPKVLISGTASSVRLLSLLADSFDSQGIIQIHRSSHQLISGSLLCWWGGKTGQTQRSKCQACWEFRELLIKLSYISKLP